MQRTYLLVTFLGNGRSDNGCTVLWSHSHRVPSHTPRLSDSECRHMSSGRLEFKCHCTALLWELVNRADQFQYSYGRVQTEQTRCHGSHYKGYYCLVPCLKSIYILERHYCFHLQDLRVRQASKQQEVRHRICCLLDLTIAPENGRN
jgi:hypothetical protein